MNVIKEIEKLNDAEIKLGIAENTDASWHAKYKDSAYVFVGGLDYALSEGDVLAVFSQYGAIVDINLVRDRQTGKSKGFCFLGFKDQRSTVLSVDNFNGIKLRGRTIRVDHCQDYRIKKREDATEEELAEIEENERKKKIALGLITDPTAKRPTRSPSPDSRGRDEHKAMKARYKELDRDRLTSEEKKERKELKRKLKQLQEDKHKRRRVD